MKNRITYTDIEMAIAEGLKAYPDAEVIRMPAARVGLPSVIAVNSDKATVFKVYKTFDEKLNPCFYNTYANI